MNAPISDDPCPSRQALSDLLNSRIHEEGSQDTVRHIDSCQKCQDTVANILRDFDLKGLELAESSGKQTAECSNAVERLAVIARSVDAVAVENSPRPATSTRPGPSAEKTALPEFIGPYRVLNRLGTGGMGAVYRAFDPSLERDVAIKLMATQLVDDEQSRARFLREARAAAAVRHPNIVAIHAVEETLDPPAIVMECVEGLTLEQHLATSQQLPIDEALRITTEVAFALEAAHAQGLVHRDVKPSNVLLDSVDGRARLTDFGLARLTSLTTTVTASGEILGTPQFMSPEQCEGNDVDHRSDLFSLGVMLYRMLTGRLPFQADSPVAVIRRICDHDPEPITESDDIPVWLQRVLSQLLEKAPERRVQSATELVRLLNTPNVASGNSPEKTSPRFTRQAARRGSVAVGAVVLLACLCEFLGVTGFVYQQTSGPLQSGSSTSDSAAVPLAIVDEPAPAVVTPALSSGIREEFLTAMTSDDWAWSASEPLPLFRDNGDKHANPFVSHDGLTLLFVSGGIHQGQDLFESRRQSLGEPWPDAVRLSGGVNSPDNETCPTMSADGLLLVFASERPASTSGTNLWQSERRSLDDEWSEPRQLTGVNSSSADGFPALSADGLALAFSSYREGGRGARDVWISTRPSRDAPWSSPENAGRAVNTSANELPQQILSPEDLLIFTRHEGGTYRDVWAAAIGRENSTFQPAVQLDTSFSSHLEAASFAPDRRTLIYQSARNGANEPAHLRGVRRSRIDSR